MRHEVSRQVLAVAGRALLGGLGATSVASTAHTACTVQRELVRDSCGSVGAGSTMALAPPVASIG
jgi:hypothetical protein